MKNMCKIIAFVAASVLFSACMSTTAGGSVGADRSQVMLISEAEMNQQAESSYAEVLAEAKKNKTLNPDAATTNRVRNIANRLIAQCGAFRTDALNWNWQVNCVTPGLLPKTRMRESFRPSWLLQEPSHIT